MKSPDGASIITLSTIVLLSVASLANAQSPLQTNPSRTIRGSQILPYLLDNPTDNSLMRVRCIPQDRQEVDRDRRIIRDSLLRQTPSDRVARPVTQPHCVRLSQSGALGEPVLPEQAWQQTGDRNENITIEIEGSCQNVNIRVQDGSKFSDFPAYNPYLDLLR
ncbi:MAG: hypothetical protein KME32_13070 [Mojavia pulchra JT2-VF2]|jgi:hypothetical protein|uniref:Uncharacterized protein n=1 Tax=Mojavia pulchra JT2-VF2 TaxID=287848 RepID=A0A951PXC1_9NOST|nr:hypothetical protein [Mojavia pulchra JT2-VF2]